MYCEDIRCLELPARNCNKASKSEIKLFNNFLSHLQTNVDECVKLCMKEYQGKIEVEKHMKEAFCQ